MRRGGGRGRGVTALFAGDSGTGKTMSAEVIAAELGLDLYTVNLATVVDKYIGETEKNLERIFAEAGGVNAVLFFDEADAIFGKRSEVQGRPRPLRQHRERVPAAAAGDLRRAGRAGHQPAGQHRRRVHPAAGRDHRLPGADAELRRALWVRCLAPPLPLADDLDLDFCAESFEMAGGNIRSASTTAAYLAAAAGTPCRCSR